MAVAGSPITASAGFQIESPLSQLVTTDQTTYQPGAVVQLSATETNMSDQAITLLNVNDQFTVIGLGGVTLPGVSTSSSSPVVTLQPGQTQTFEATWNTADVTDSTSIPTGSYTVLFQDNFQGATSVCSSLRVPRRIRRRRPAVPHRIRRHRPAVPHRIQHHRVGPRRRLRIPRERSSPSE